jgi:predicted DNA-binding transcriptional regulator AlpA
MKTQICEPKPEAATDTTKLAAIPVEFQPRLESDRELKTFLAEKELLKRLPISRRTLFDWRTSGKIPCVRLGGRRILFHWPSVEAALLRQQRGGEQ